MNFHVTGKRGSTGVWRNNVKKDGDSQGRQGISSDYSDHRFVEDTEHGNDVDELWLADELRKDSNIVQGPLSIRVSHSPIQEIEGAFLSRVIESYTWEGDDFHIR